MLLADYSGDLGHLLAIVMMIWGAVVIFRGVKKAAGNALRDENTRKKAASWVVRSIWGLFK